MRFLRVRAGRPLIELSRAAVMLLLGLGCASHRTIELRPAAVRAAAKDYAERGVAVVEDVATHELVEVTPRDQPTLLIASREDALGEERLWDCLGSLSAPLADVATDDAGITVEKCRLATHEIESASLSVDREARAWDASDRSRGPRDGDQRNHRLGLQVGGSGYFQVSYRYRLLQPLFVDLGALGVNHAFNGSAGVVVEAPLSERWYGYAGFGGGLAAAFGDATDPACDAEPDDCPTVSSSTHTAFVYVRLGIAHAFGRERRHFVSVDAGAWWGAISEDDGRTQDSRPLLWPMAGLAYHCAL